MRILWQSFTAPGTRYLQVLQNTVQSLAPADVEVDVVGLHPSDSFIHRLSELRCAYAVIAQNLDAQHRGYDAVVIGHFQDGGLHELRSALDIPVVGLGECAMHHALQLGESFGLVTIDPGFLAVHRAQVRTYQLDAKFAGVAAMRTDVTTYMAAFEGDRDQVRRVADEFRGCAMELVESGADVIIPAGGLPALLLWSHDLVPDLNGAAALDPLGLAIGQAALWARLGPKRVSPGRRASYVRPQPGVTDELAASLASPPNNHVHVSTAHERKLNEI